MRRKKKLLDPGGMTPAEVERWLSRNRLTGSQLEGILGQRITTGLERSRIFELALLYIEKELEKEQHFGPVTLIYSEDPIVLNGLNNLTHSYTVRAERWTNLQDAIERLEGLWGKPDVYNPQLIDGQGKVLWDSFEIAEALERSN